MIKNYIMGMMLVLSFVSLDAMDRIVVRPDNIQVGDAVQVAGDQEIVPYLRLTKKTQVHDFVVIMESNTSHEQPVWAQVITVNKVLERSHKFQAVMLYTVIQNQRKNGLQVRREIPADCLYALVYKSVFDYYVTHDDKENENMMNVHYQSNGW